MPVNLVISKTLSGAAVSDTLAGGSSGLDLGSVNNAEYAPITSKTANTGFQRIYIRHNATVDPISNVRTFIQTYSGTYGGAAASAAADFATLVSKGNASSTSANNSDGNGAGLRIEHGADLGNTLGASAFDATRAQVKIYGRNNADGISIDTAFPLHVDALIYDSQPHGTPGTAVAATAPQTGKIGKDGDSVLGDNALVKLRFYLETAAPQGGVIQWDWAIGYSFTS